MKLSLRFRASTFGQERFTARGLRADVGIDVLRKWHLPDAPPLLRIVGSRTGAGAHDSGGIAPWSCGSTPPPKKKKKTVAGLPPAWGILTQRGAESHVMRISPPTHPQFSGGVAPFSHDMRGGF